MNVMYDRESNIRVNLSILILNLQTGLGFLAVLLKNNEWVSMKFDKDINFTLMKFSESLNEICKKAWFLLNF